MKKITIAEILHLAADEHLASKESELRYAGGNKEKFSCNAVIDAAWKLWNEDEIESGSERNELIDRCHKGLKAMGCPVESMFAFGSDTAFNKENQQARYAWLKFAAMIAEEQDV